MLIGSIGSAQTLTARVSSEQLSVGDNFKVIYELQGNGSQFSAPAFDGFLLLAGPNKASNMQWVNGEFSSSTSYSFLLRTTKEGVFEIGPASIVSQGKKVLSNAVEVKVSGQAAQNRPPNPQKPNRNRTQVGQDQISANEISSNLFLKLFVDDKDVYVGEQVLATYKLYLNAAIMNYEFSNLVFNGFYAEDLKVDGKDVQLEVINGKQFEVHTLKQTLLTPQKSGVIEVPALESDMVIRVQERRRSRSLFDQVFGNYRNARVSIASNVEKINVKPLPKMDQPTDFSGAVGTFDVSLESDLNQVRVNEAITIELEVAGSGNLELVSLPDIPFPQDFEAYDPKLKSNMKTSAVGTTGSKTNEYVVIPRFAGTYTIKPISFSYFDPQKESYVRLATEPLELTIMPSESDEQVGVAFTAPKKEDVQIIGKDIRFIKTGEANLRRSEDRFFGSTIFYIVSSLPFAGMGAAIFLITFFRAQQSDVRSLKSKRAKGVAKKHLAKAKKEMDDEDAGFFEAISDALFGYLSDKLIIDLSDLNRERIEDELRTRGVSDHVQSELKKALDECEMVRFAPGVVRSPQEMLAATSEIIETLEDEL